MSQTDQKNLNLTIYNFAAFLNCYITDVNRKLEELEEDHVKSDDDVKTLMKLKKDHEAVSMAFEVFKSEFSEPDSLVILTHIKMDFKDLMTIFVAFMHIEDCLNTKCNELMIELSKSGVRPAVKEGLLSENGRKAEEGSSVLMQKFERLKIQEDNESETSKSGRKGKEGGCISMEWLKILGDCVENKINEGSDIGGQRQDVSDSKSEELGIQRFKIQEDYVAETSKSGEERGSVSMEGLELLLENYAKNKTNDGSDIGGQRVELWNGSEEADEENEQRE